MEKIGNLKITTVPVIVGAQDMINKERVKTLKSYLAVPARTKHKNSHFVELLISLVYISPKRGRKKTYNT